MKRKGVLSILAGTMAIAALIGAMTLRTRQAPRSNSEPSPVGPLVAVVPPAPDPPHAQPVERGAAALAPSSSAEPEPLLDEAQLMKRLRLVEDTNPALGLVLAREGNRRFPDSSDAAERAAVIVKCLALQGFLSKARGEAETMVNQYPGTPWALEVEQQTGAHPRRSHLAP